MLCKLVYTSVTRVSGSSCSSDKPWTWCSYLRGQERGPKPIFLQGVLQVSLELGTGHSSDRHLPHGVDEAQRNPGIYLRSHSKTALRLGVGVEESLRREQQIRLRPWLRPGCNLGGMGTKGS